MNRTCVNKGTFFYFHLGHFHAQCEKVSQNPENKNNSHSESRARTEIIPSLSAVITFRTHYVFPSHYIRSGICDGVSAKNISFRRNQFDLS